jgi:hypothetical protein
MAMVMAMAMAMAIAMAMVIAMVTAMSTVAAGATAIATTTVMETVAATPWMLLVGGREFMTASITLTTTTMIDVDDACLLVHLRRQHFGRVIVVVIGSLCVFITESMLLQIKDQDGWRQR